jgi:hypothetical protein
VYWQCYASEVVVLTSSWLGAYAGVTSHAYDYVSFDGTSSLAAGGLI